MTRTAALARLELTLVYILAGVHTARLLAVRAISAIALLSLFHDAVAAQRATVLLETEFGAKRKRVQDRPHLIPTALRKIAVVLVHAGGSAPVHDKVAALAGARRALAIVRIVLGAEVVADFVCKRDLRYCLGHTRLVVNHRDNATVEALLHLLQRLSLLAHATHASRQLGHPGEAKRAVSEVARGERVGQTVVGEIVQRDVVEERGHVQIGLA